MDSEARAMTEQMKGTLAGLTDKLGRLEHRGSDTVSSVQDSVNTVWNALDLKLHVRQRPWTLVGGATALGFIVGAGAVRLPVVRSPQNARNNGADAEQYLDTYADDPGNGNHAAQFSGPPAPGWMAKLGKTFEPEIDELKGIATEMLIGIVREIIAKQTQKQTESAVDEHRNNSR